MYEQLVEIESNEKKILASNKEVLNNNICNIEKIISNKKLYFLFKILMIIINFFILLYKKQIISKIFICDVLFIVGVSKIDLNQVYRYRVLHQIEQLKAGYLTSKDVFYLDLDPDIVRNFRVIIFCRCPWTDKVGEAILIAKSLNKKILFEIDDLVFDTKYTNTNTYVQKLSVDEKKLYDDGVIAMGKTLKLCDGAITTTPVLANELIKNVPLVFINFNVASEEMWKLSKEALQNKILNKDKIIIGYFSGSISHNLDFGIIKRPLKKILEKFSNVNLLIVGHLDLSEDFKKFSSRIIRKSFVDWKLLPQLLANIDINIIPLENNFFNTAKSENKWVEASLVKVPSIATEIGIFKNVIENRETGILCLSEEDWYNGLKDLITDENLRKNIGEKAYNVVKEKYNTIISSSKFVHFINSIAKKHIGFILPSLGISGGVKVALKHASFLQEEGHDVEILLGEYYGKYFEFEGHKFNVISMNDVILDVQYDILVGTLYSTIYPILAYQKVKRKLYLVQGYETEFSPYGEQSRFVAENTYYMNFGVEYITISKWIEKWLKEKYNQNSKFAPNGIDIDAFTEHRRNLNKDKIRILIEGDNTAPNKNIDESFKIIEKLDPNKYEAWYMTYFGEPKSWYRVSKFLLQVPYEKVNEVYNQCDILLKSSLIESFSYPPLEMMATGGYSIVVKNDGNIEYLKDEENCLFYERGNLDSAVEKIERLIKNEKLQKRLYENGIRTAKERDWKNFKDKILKLYK